jgi:hypothetical protein
MSPFAGLVETPWLNPELSDLEAAGRRAGGDLSRCLECILVLQASVCAQELSSRSVV